MRLHFCFKRMSWSVMLFAGAVFLSSCASSGYHTAEGRKFDEAEFADLVLKYASDQTIFMVKPDGHEGAFYRIFNRDEICALDAQRLGRRDMAVVMIGFNRDLAVEQQIKEEWVSSLTKLNYHRVVFLRSSDHNEVNGLRVIEDRSLALSPERHELTFADAGVAEQRK